MSSARYISEQTHAEYQERLNYSVMHEKELKSNCTDSTYRTFEPEHNNSIRDVCFENKREQYITVDLFKQLMRVVAIDFSDEDLGTVERVAIHDWLESLRSEIWNVSPSYTSMKESWSGMHESWRKSYGEAHHVYHNRHLSGKSPFFQVRFKEGALVASSFIKYALNLGNALQKVATSFQVAGMMWFMIMEMLPASVRDRSILSWVNPQRRKEIDMGLKYHFTFSFQQFKESVPYGMNSAYYKENNYLLFPKEYRTTLIQVAEIGFRVKSLQRPTSSMGPNKPLFQFFCTKWTSA